MRERERERVSEWQRDQGSDGEVKRNATCLLILLHLRCSFIILFILFCHFLCCLFFSPTFSYLGLPALVFIYLLVNISYLKYIVSQSSQWYLQDSRALQMFYVLQPYLHWPLEMKYSYLKGVREEVTARLNESHGCWLRNLLNWGLTLWSYATPFPFLPFSSLSFPFVNIFLTYIPFNRLNNSLFTLSLGRPSR